MDNQTTFSRDNAMPIQFSCSRCGKRMQAPDLVAGKKAECPQCKAINRVPVPEGFDQLLPPPVVPPPEISRTESKPPGNRIGWVRLPRPSWRAWLIMSGLAFLLTLRTPPGPWVLLHYLAGILALGLLLNRIAQSRVPQWSKPIALAGALFAALLWGQTDYYIEHRDKFTSEGELQSVVTNYVYRGHYRPFYQKTTVWDGRGGFSSTEGGYSESGKEHGPWERYSTGDYRVQHDWYWYGEPITEGEWHLRNK